MRKKDTIRALARSKFKKTLRHAKKMTGAKVALNASVRPETKERLLHLVADGNAPSMSSAIDLLVSGELSSTGQCTAKKAEKHRRPKVALRASVRPETKEHLLRLVVNGNAPSVSSAIDLVVSGELPRDGRGAQTAETHAYAEGVLAGVLLTCSRETLIVLTGPRGPLWDAAAALIIETSDMSATGPVRDSLGRLARAELARRDDCEMG